MTNITYQRLFAAQVVALLGTGLLTVALSLLAFEVSPNSAGSVVATALTIKILAYVLLAPSITAVTSRWSPRTVLIGADLIRLVTALSLLWVSEVWHIYALIFILQAASATFTPTFQAVIPVVLPDERDYTRALSLSRVAYDLEAVASPVIAAGMLLLIDFHGLFAGTALGFALSAGLVLGSGLKIEGAEQTSSFASRVSSGVRMFCTRRPLVAVILLDLAAACAMATVLVNTVVVVRQDLALGPVALSTTLATFGAGSMLVALALPRVLDHRKPLPVMMIGGGATALGLAVAAMTGPWGSVLIAWALLGAATSAVLTPSGAVVNLATSPSERPAAYAAHFSLSHACYLITYPMAGWLGATAGVATSTAVLASTAACATAFAGVVLVRGSSGVNASARQ
ncbi:MFS transporter [Aeromicrobium sp. Sec7.5]|uniref:MFS transporter n=1 Tax=Aeromicrobium sp. Sec7.5 TaxID=3121276 RepID=UPI002FE48F78